MSDATAALPPGGEALMARAALRVGGVVVVPIVAAAWLLRGIPGGLTALGAVALVVGSFAVTGMSLDWAGRHGLAVLQGVALGGFFVRLVLYAVGIVLLVPIEAIDGHVLAISVAVVTVILLTYEVRLLARHAQLWWVQPGAAHGKERA